MAVLATLFFVTAVVYAMAGFGGGSTYLALLVLFEVPFEEIRSTALICNLAVVSFGTWNFARKGHLHLQRVMPFLISSIPMAYLGGTVSIGKATFTLLLGLSLAVAAIRMLWIGEAVKARSNVSKRYLYAVGLPLGGLLGFLAGLVGIGGGIYLAPVLLFLGWTDAKMTAAACSLFILVNSVAGLFGQCAQGCSINWSLVLPLIVSVICGGQIGSRLGANVVSKLSLQKITGALILLVSGRLLWGLV